MAEEFGSCSSSSESSFREAATPLSAVAEAFEELARIVKDGNGELRLSTFCDACSLVSVLFSCLGIAFRFAELEYVSKVRPFQTLPSPFLFFNTCYSQPSKSFPMKTGLAADHNVVDMTSALS